jgi:hypothetical protein
MSQVYVGYYNLVILEFRIALLQSEAILGCWSDYIRERSMSYNLALEVLNCLWGQ